MPCELHAKSGPAVDLAAGMQTGHIAHTQGSNTAYHYSCPTMAHGSLSEDLHSPKATPTAGFMDRQPYICRSARGESPLKPLPQTRTVASANMLTIATGCIPLNGPLLPQNVSHMPPAPMARHPDATSLASQVLPDSKVDSSLQIAARTHPPPDREHTHVCTSEPGLSHPSVVSPGRSAHPAVITPYPLLPPARMVLHHHTPTKHTHQTSVQWVKLAQ